MMKMKLGSLLAGVIAGAAMGLTVEARSGTDTGLEARPNDDTVAVARQRLAQSLTTIQAVYEVTRGPGQVQRRHLWLVGEAIPWRSTLQPSCLRQRDYQLKQTPESWPVASDAPSLRALLADQVPGIRALAAEALATLQQPEDMPRLAALVTDPAEATMELMAPTIGQFIKPEDLISPGPDAVTRHTWHKSCVANHAAWGLYLMLGDCCPEAIVNLQFARFRAFGHDQLSHLPRIDPSILAPLAAGDPKDHLWYWQEYIHRALHQLDDAAEGVVRKNTPGFDKLDWRRQSNLIADERRRAKKEWMESFITDMRAWPAERRAMVRLLVSNVHQGGADMAYYGTPGWLLFGSPLDLGLEKDRIRELLDGIRVWPDERRDRGGRSQVVERLALGWRECFDAQDVPRLLARFSRDGDLWWSARAALVVALANLMPTTGTASEDPATAEGFLRRTLKEDHEVLIRTLAASELMRMGLDVHWPLLLDRFFADRDNGDTLPSRILEWFMKAPAGDGPTRKLIDLVSDNRYRPLWLEPERTIGKAAQGGICRRLACEALKARVGRAVVTDEDLTALKDPEQGPTRLRLILARVHEVGKQ